MVLVIEKVWLLSAALAIVLIFPGSEKVDKFCRRRLFPYFLNLFLESLICFYFLPFQSLFQSCFYITDLCSQTVFMFGLHGIWWTSSGSGFLEANIWMLRFSSISLAFTLHFEVCLFKLTGTLQMMYSARLN
jgi:hypothetical protein